MKQIETSKGRFVVIDDKKETHYPFHMYIQLYGDNYYKLSEINELEALSIIDDFEKVPYDVPNNVNYCKLLLNSMLK